MDVLGKRAPMKLCVFIIPQGQMAFGNQALTSLCRPAYRCTDNDPAPLERIPHPPARGLNGDSEPIPADMDFPDIKSICSDSGIDDRFDGACDCS